MISLALVLKWTPGRSQGPLRGHDDDAALLGWDDDAPLLGWDDAAPAGRSLLLPPRGRDDAPQAG